MPFSPNPKNPLAVRSLAAEFDHLLHRHMSSQDLFAAIMKNNAEANNPETCHTHDYIDSNESMEMAFQNVFGRESDIASEEDAEIVNRAWRLWRDTYRGGYIYSAFSLKRR